MSPRFAVVYSRDYAKQYPESETAEYVADGADLYWMCVDTTSGRVLGADGGAPEDALLVRDWRWVPRELNAVNAERDDAREKLRALVDAIDRDEDAFTRWVRNEPGVTDATLAEAEAALDAATKAARGAL